MEDEIIGMWFLNKTLYLHCKDRFLYEVAALNIEQ